MLKNRKNHKQGKRQTVGWADERCRHFSRSIRSIWLRRSSFQSRCTKEPSIARIGGGSEDGRGFQTHDFFPSFIMKKSLPYIRHSPPGHLELPCALAGISYRKRRKKGTRTIGIFNLLPTIFYDTLVRTKGLRMFTKGNQITVPCWMQEKMRAIEILSTVMKGSRLLADILFGGFLSFFFQL